MPAANTAHAARRSARLIADPAALRPWLCTKPDALASGICLVFKICIVMRLHYGYLLLYTARQKVKRIAAVACRGLVAVVIWPKAAEPTVAVGLPQCGW